MVDSPIEVVLVDDEPLALTNLRAVLARAPDVAIVGECADGVEALATITARRPALALLDVQMPGMDGIEVARRLVDRGAPPLVVFVTAYDQFAIDAFEVHAVDYLLKPYSDARLLRTIDRCREALRSRRQAELTARLTTLVGALSDARGGAEVYTQRILIPDAGRTWIVLTAEIKWISGARNYVELHTDRETYIHRSSLDAIEATLDPRRFARIHRSTIVGLERVRELITEGGRRTVVLDEGTRLAVSKTYLDELMARLGG
ncbi:MAG: LytTR family DNA-binding domain-containing protein [Nannocystaceae bacterium]|nr:response regulator transcription factor [Myxococcales bacterium]